MDKALYIKKLFDCLKDSVEFDEDVKALFRLLKKLLKIDLQKGIDDWMYLMKKYNLKEIKGEIDWNPLINQFLLELLKYKSLNDVFSLLFQLSEDNMLIIEETFFNTFETTSGIYSYFKRNVFNEKNSIILNDLKHILKFKNNFNKLFFDETTLLKNIILLHLEHHFINLSHLTKIADLVQNPKEQAILKSLFIDYI